MVSFLSRARCFLRRACAYILACYESSLSIYVYRHVYIYERDASPLARARERERESRAALSRRVKLWPSFLQRARERALASCERSGEFSPPSSEMRAVRLPYRVHQRFFFAFFAQAHFYRIIKPARCIRAPMRRHVALDTLERRNFFVALWCACWCSGLNVDVYRLELICYRCECESEVMLAFPRLWFAGTFFFL